MWGFGEYFGNRVGECRRKFQNWCQWVILVRVNGTTWLPDSMQQIELPGLIASQMT